ncbi:MAG: TMEM175 family protein [Microbacteriaceae bacterium]
MHSERGFDRLVNFSDAVVAIAITLLVLPLVTEASNLSQESVGEFLRANAMQFFSFFLSFIIIGRFWLVHHQMFERLRDFNKPILVWNLLWLLGIVFLAFPTELFATSGGDDVVTNALYIGTMLWITVALLGISLTAYRSPELFKSGDSGDAHLSRGVAMVVLLVVALGVCLLWPMIGLYSLFALFFTRPIERLLQRR